MSTRKTVGKWFFLILSQGVIPVVWIWLYVLSAFEPDRSLTDLIDIKHMGRFVISPVSLALIAGNVILLLPVWFFLDRKKKDSGPDVPQ